jgi:alpha-tubulin suppressor-like RCC1 family protein
LGWCGLTAAGAAWCYVEKNAEPLRAVPGGQAFTQISTGAFSYLALDAQGNVWSGTLDAAPRTTELVPSTPFMLALPGPAKDAQVSAQYWVSAPQPFEANQCQLEATGAIRCTGWNTYGQLGNGMFRAMGGGSSRVTSVVAAELAVGSTHVCSLSEGAEVWCWGSSWAGEPGATAPGLCDLGGSTSIACRATPAPVMGLAPASHVWAGINFSCAELKTGELQCWGANDKGQLGNGSGVTALTTTIGR